MAEEKKITISRTLNGKIIYFIARNSTGKIIARELTQEKLEEAIKTYREPPLIEEKAVEPLPDESEPKKKFLINKLAKKVEKRKEQSEKKSFWDKLK